MGDKMDLAKWIAGAILAGIRWLWVNVIRRLRFK